MKKIFWFFSLIILSIFTVAMLQAQSRNIGLNSFQFLKIGNGARSVGMGSANTAIYDIEQIFNNPAGTTLKDKSWSFGANYNKWLAGLTQSSLGISYNWQDIGTVSLGVQALSAGNIDADRDLEMYGGTDAYGTDPYGTYSYMDLGISLTYSKYLLDNLSLGITAKYLNETIDDKSAYSFAFDIGSIYDIGILNWKIASRLSNLGSDAKFYDFNHPIPMTFSIGTSIIPLAGENYKLLLSGEALKSQDQEQLFYAGGEIALFEKIFLRGGYKFNYQGTEAGNSAKVLNGATSLGTKTDISIEKYSFGVGFQVPVNEYDVRVDYAYTKMNIISDVHRVSLHFSLK